MFKELNEEETKKFVQWADDHKDEAEYNPAFHPVVNARWVELGLIECQKS